MRSSTLAQRFSLQGPLILAPLGGGPCTPELVSAVCNHGALGSIGAAYMDADTLREFTQKVRSQTTRPFALNLFIPAPDPVLTDAQIARALAATAGDRQELNLPSPQWTAPFAEDFEKQFESMLSLKPAVFSFVFGRLAPEQLHACQCRGIFTMGTATTLEEALALEATGVNAVIAQGFEAGGHRGIFDDKADDPEIGVLDLVRACAKRLQIPIVAAGGLMSGADIARVQDAGADAAQLGTAYMNADEAGTSKPYREELTRAKSTRITRAFSGRWARGIENRFMREMDKKSEAILPFPAQNKFTRDLRTASAQAGKADFLSLWAGTGVGQIRSAPAGAITEDLLREWREA